MKLLFLALVCGVFIASSEVAIGAEPSTKLLQLGANGAPISSNDIKKTRAILARRFTAANIPVEIKLLSKSRLLLLFESAITREDLERLTSRGRLSLRIYPNGEVFPQRPKPIVHAVAGRNDFGQPTVLLTLGNPKAFAAFEKTNLGKRLGIFIDGQLILAPDIVAASEEPLSIVGNLSMHQARVLAALIDSPLLPLAVRLGGTG